MKLSRLGWLAIGFTVACAAISTRNVPTPAATATSTAPLAVATTPVSTDPCAAIRRFLGTPAPGRRIFFSPNVARIGEMLEVTYSGWPSGGAVRAVIDPAPGEAYPEPVLGTAITDSGGTGILRFVMPDDVHFAGGRNLVAPGDGCLPLGVIDDGNKFGAIAMLPTTH